MEIGKEISLKGEIRGLRRKEEIPTSPLAIPLRVAAY